MVAWYILHFNTEFDCKMIQLQKEIISQLGKYLSVISGSLATFSVVVARGA